MISALVIGALLGIGLNARADANLYAAMDRANSFKQPLVVIVADSGRSRTDKSALLLLETKEVNAKMDQIQQAVLDISVSRNRVTAARFHVTETPVFFCLSSKGIIISRDEKHLKPSLVLKRIEEAAQRGPELDAKLSALKLAAGLDRKNMTAQFDLTDFLIAHQNAFEAIPRFETISRTVANDPASRVRAWVAVGRAHLWIGEPEKARHEADDLITMLGPVTPEALAGGNLVHGLQDAGAKRVELARKEFEDAIAAAPESSYGKEAREALAKLPKHGK